MRWLVAGDTEPIAIAVRAPGFSVETHPAVLARLVVGVSDTITFRVIPEPSDYGFLLGGLLLLVAFGSRLRKQGASG